MIRALIFVLLCLTALVGAGVYGAVHNQLSYSIGASYFTDVKFAQFDINRNLPERIGAAQVGWLASWWMGLAIAVPIMLLGWVRVPGALPYLKAGLSAIGLTLSVSMLGAFLGLAYGFITEPNGLIQGLPNPDALSDPEGFVRASLMHNGSYIGSVLGSMFAFIRLWRTSSGKKNI